MDDVFVLLKSSGSPEPEAICSVLGVVFVPVSALASEESIPLGAKASGAIVLFLSFSFL